MANRRGGLATQVGTSRKRDLSKLEENIEKYKEHLEKIGFNSQQPRKPKILSINMTDD